jgi:hypothetical protein
MLVRDPCKQACVLSGGLISQESVLELGWFAQNERAATTSKFVKETCSVNIFLQEC